MQKKALFGSIAALLTGLGIYRFVSMRRNNKSNTRDHWTTANVPDLAGKVIIVTGANSGLGFEAAKEFARKRAQTVLACRNMDRAQAAVSRIRAEIPNAPVEILQLDLASLASVRRFADVFEAKYERLEVLVNNAGILMVPYSRTEDGFERHFGTNHLGHFALTGLLIDLLLGTAGSRVVNVSSVGHRFDRMDFDNLMYEDGNDYSPMRAYGRSKLANLLFTYELQRRYEAIGANAVAVAAHPGSAHTNLSSYLKDRWFYKAFGFLEPVIIQSAAMGALPIIRAATDPNVKGGQYYGPGGFLEQRGYPVIVQSNDASHDEQAARRLWQVSEQLTSVYYTQLDEASTSPLGHGCRQGFGTNVEASDVGLER
jgi:NAD(P)-dependent dehydrogenase (short-subunit alcohol dehydrogenase family)